jgi:hypothetical protein
MLGTISLVTEFTKKNCSKWEGEAISCLRPGGDCDRHGSLYLTANKNSNATQWENDLIKSIFIYLSMALQPFVGPYPLFSVSWSFTPWTGGSARRKAATYTHNNTNTE